MPSDGLGDLDGSISFSLAMSPSSLNSWLTWFWDGIIIGTACWFWNIIIRICIIRNSCCSCSCSHWCCFFIALFSSLWCFSSNSPIAHSCLYVPSRSSIWLSFTDPSVNASWSDCFVIILNLGVLAQDGILEVVLVLVLRLLLPLILGVNGPGVVELELDKQMPS